jgi:hypothetical protein
MAKILKSVVCPSGCRNWQDAKGLGTELAGLSPDCLLSLCNPARWSDFHRHERMILAVWMH